MRNHTQSGARVENYLVMFVKSVRVLIESNSWSRFGCPVELVGIKYKPRNFWSIPNVFLSVASQIYKAPRSRLIKRRRQVKTENIIFDRFLFA